MASVKEHYDQHLGPVYGWMLGDMTAALNNARTELRDMGLSACADGLAVDLGAGPGVHSIPLAELGYSVVAVDTCAGLLQELKNHASSHDIRPVVGDLLSFRAHVDSPVDAILCMGDTLTHLSSCAAVERLFQEVQQTLSPNGVFLATFRDYVSAPLEGTSRFIPVRADSRRILTCFLEYREHSVMVHDLLYTLDSDGWKLKVSAYPKLRLDPAWAQAKLNGLGLKARLEPGPRGMVRLIASASNRSFQRTAAGSG
jgi:SAM-dependent methyltransferase